MTTAFSKIESVQDNSKISTSSKTQQKTKHHKNVKNSIAPCATKSAGPPATQRIDTLIETSTHQHAIPSSTHQQHLKENEIF
jgi:hypothetical protein